MAEKLCTLRTKGGGGQKYTETSLWTNSAPTSDFAGQTVTLSDNISNYKYIAIKFKAAKALTDTIKTIVSIEDLAKLVGGANSLQVRLGGVNNNASYSYSRSFYKASDTTISISGAYASNTQASANSMAIPLEILGLNELATGHRLRETILWTNSAPTSSFSGQTVTLSESLSNYDMVRLYWRKTTSDSSEMYIDVSVSDYTSITGNTGSFQIYIGYRHSNGGCGRSVGGSGSTAKYGNCYFFGSSTSMNNANVIPTKVAGLRIS